MDCFASLAMTAEATDCFAEPVIGLRIHATRWLAMTTERENSIVVPAFALAETTTESRQCYASNTASAPFTASALSITVRSSAPACTVTFSAKNRASVT
jgi:hypothetical protein